ncbi:hypothetical protein IKE_03069 [Bacillus cereus VD196]|uniref:Hemolysin II n=1 Tax=Bacillus cereus VD196 TaxID=1053243 RepID=A0A9W5V7P9_BACCE|nr:hypothetical protein [Bacillus cereus]EOO65023.1 hypothetical protein IKE_03993 [Bacillus cereus VD196]EOO66511.1 hypothetical protein IKE_03069 [Bacillus cereus VD196]
MTNSIFTRKKTLLLLMAIMLILTSVLTFNTNAKAEEIQDDLTEQDLATFKLLDEIPEDTIQKGMSETIIWLNENKNNKLRNYTFNQKGEHIVVEVKSPDDITNKSRMKRATWQQYTACGLALGNVALNVVPWATLLKLRNAAKAIGGLESLFTKVSKAYHINKNMGKSNPLGKAVSQYAHSFPDELKKAVTDIFGVGAASAACSLLFSK